MKTIFRNSRWIAIAMITVFISGFTQAPTGLEKALVVELKCIGGYNNHSILQLNISGNENQNDFIILIRDEFANIIYRENIKAAQIIKKFLFDIDELGNDTLQLEVFCKKTNKSVIYAINRQAKYAESITVRELK